MPAPRTLARRLHRLFPPHSWRRIAVTGLYGLVLLQALILAANNFSVDRPVLGLRYEHEGLLFPSPTALQHLIASDIVQEEMHPVTLTAGSYTAHITPRQFGADYNPDAIYGQTVGVGREGSWLHRLWQQDKAFVGQIDIVLDLSSVSKDAILQFLAYVNTRSSQPPANAGFALKSGTVAITAGVPGRHLDIDRAYAIFRRIQPAGSAPITLPMTADVPAISAADLRPFLPDAKTIVSAPLQLAAADQNLTVSPAQLLSMVRPVRVPDPGQPSRTIVRLELQDGALSAPLDQVSALAQKDAKPEIVAGRRVISPGQAGLHIDGIHAKVALASEIASRQILHSVHTEVTIPSEALEPPVVDQYAGDFPAYSGGSPAVTLTFDDGPNGTYTEPILDILKRYNTHAIFFLIGQNVNAYPDVARRILEGGHTLGNHSYTHSQLTHLSLPAVASELDRTQEAINLTAAFTPSIFRPPYGDISAAIRDLATARSLRTMMWSVDPRDWAEPGAAVIADRVVSAAQPGSNILLHVLHQQTVDALPAIIEGLHKRGFVIN